MQGKPVLYTKKKMIIKSLLLGFLLIVACDSGYIKNSTVVFSETVRLKGEQILDNEIGIRSLNIVNDSLLVIKRMSEPIFSIYCLETLAPVTTFGSRGKGPDEFLSPNIMQSFRNSNLSNNLQILDRSKKVRVVVDLKSLIYENKQIFIEKENYSKDSDFIHYSNITKNKRLCFNDLYELSIFDLTSNSKSSIQQKKVYRNYNFKSEGAKRHFNFSTVLLNPDSLLIAVISDNIPQIDIYEIKSRQNNPEIAFIKSVFTDKLPKKIRDHEIYDGSFMVFNYSGSSNSSYLYVLNINQQDSDIQKIEKPVSILVLDWNGNAIRKYEIAEYINQIAVDEKNKFIYGVNYFQDKIFRYKIGFWAQRN